MKGGGCALCRQSFVTLLTPASMETRSLTVSITINQSIGTNLLNIVALRNTLTFKVYLIPWILLCQQRKCHSFSKTKLSFF